MKTRLDQAAKNWLKVERRGIDTAAERALERVFRRLPMPAPGPDLSRRTLVALGLGAVRAPRPHWAYRCAVAAALALTGLATALGAPGLSSSLGSKIGANWLVEVGAGLLTDVSRRMAIGYTLWDVLVRAGATAAEIVSTPQTLGLMLMTVLFGLATVRALAGLVAVEGSTYRA